MSVGCGTVDREVASYDRNAQLKPQLRQNKNSKRLKPFHTNSAVGQAMVNIADDYRGGFRDLCFVSQSTTRIIKIDENPCYVGRYNGLAKRSVVESLGFKRQLRIFVV